MIILDAERHVPPAPCLTRPGWKYEAADSHYDASKFRNRQYERLIEAQPKLREQEQAA